MFKKLGLKYRTKRAAKKRNDILNNSSIETKKIGIVTCKEVYKTTGFKSFIKKLTDKGMDTDILIFSSEKNVSNSENLEYTEKDYSWSGKIQSPLVNKFIKTPFDFLFSVNTSSILHIENILALSSAKCRIGTTTHKESKHLDFMIRVKENSSIDKLTNSMLHYTEI